LGDHVGLLFDFVLADKQFADEFLLEAKAGREGDLADPAALADLANLADTDLHSNSGFRNSNLRARLGWRRFITRDLSSSTATSSMLIPTNNLFVL
jgi:hypothetical protein